MSVKFKKMMAKMKHKLGFSLIEMLVVIAIIAILVSIIIPVIGRSVTKSAAATNAANLRAIEGKISVMRTTNPELFDDVVKEGLALDAFIAHMESQGFSIITQGALILKIFDTESAAGQFYNYHVYYNTADENGVLTISTDPVVTISDVPASEKVEAGDMIIPEGVPMTVYISETGIAATYEYNGNSYTREDFAKVAETGVFDGPGSGGMTGADIEDMFNELGNKMDCENNAHKFPDGSCTCTVCTRTIHGNEGYTPNGASGHTCTRCGTSMSHQFIGSSCIANGCGYTCEHNWEITPASHTCTICGLTNSHTFVGEVCYTCTHQCKHEYIKTETTHACKYCAPTPVAHDFYIDALGTESPVCQQCGQPNPDYETCVTPDTFITLSDGSMKPIADLNYNDQLLVWNFHTGAYDVAPVSLIINHGYGDQEIIVLNFNDGTSINFVNAHAAFDADLNHYVDITAANAASFVGHNFVKMTAEGYTTVELISYEIKHEYNGAMSILSSAHYNVILNGMLTISPSLQAGSLYEPFEVREGMKYNAAEVQKDIETYGQFTYEEFSDFLTEEQFEAFGIANAKVSIGKGKTTLDGIIEMFKTFAVPYL